MAQAGRRLARGGVFGARGRLVAGVLVSCLAHAGLVLVQRWLPAGREAPAPAEETPVAFELVEAVVAIPPPPSVAAPAPPPPGEPRRQRRSRLATPAAPASPHPALAPSADHELDPIAPAPSSRAGLALRAPGAGLLGGAAPPVSGGGDQLAPARPRPRQRIELAWNDFRPLPPALADRTPREQFTRWIKAWLANPVEVSTGRTMSMEGVHTVDLAGVFLFLSALFDGDHWAEPERPRPPRQRAASAPGAENATARALRALPAVLEALWSERARPAAERRRLLFALWDECDEGSDPAAPASAARAVVLAFIARTLPAGSPDAYAPAELAALNQIRQSQARFEPYR
jgi:hypothetical protein